MSSVRVSFEFNHDNTNKEASHIIRNNILDENADLIALTLGLCNNVFDEYGVDERSLRVAIGSIHDMTFKMLDTYYIPSEDYLYMELDMIIPFVYYKETGDCNIVDIQERDEEEVVAAQSIITNYLKKLTPKALRNFAKEEVVFLVSIDIKDDDKEVANKKE